MEPMDIVDTSLQTVTGVQRKCSLLTHKIKVKTGEDGDTRVRGRKKYFLPGETITEDAGFMRGHGTYLAEGKLVASVAGVVEPINKLISVRPLKTRYAGEIGDVIVGRIIEVQVQQKRWKVDVNGRLSSILLLSSVNLPGGELRRKTAEDERTMRSFFVEGDLISAEVQNEFADGSLSLHTRSLKYGKLAQGILVRVSPSLIERRKTHFHNLPCGAHVILGNNGFIWICPTTTSEGSESGGYMSVFETVSAPVRKVIVRLRNCILALSKHKMMIQDTSIQYCYEASAGYELADLIRTEVASDIVQKTRKNLELQVTG